MSAAIDQEQLAAGSWSGPGLRGVELAGPGGLLSGLTKTVLETALEAETSKHLGSDKHDPAGPAVGDARI